MLNSSRLICQGNWDGHSLDQLKDPFFACWSSGMKNPQCPGVVLVQLYSGSRISHKSLCVKGLFLKRKEWNLLHDRALWEEMKSWRYALEWDWRTLFSFHPLWSLVRIWAVLLHHALLLQRVAWLQVQSKQAFVPQSQTRSLQKLRHSKHFCFVSGWSLVFC